MESQTKVKYKENSVNGSRMENDAADSFSRECYAQHVALDRQQATASKCKCKLS
ncbi:hypothetical protein SK128_000048, partial [Halocaridina rubra]